MGHLEVDSPIQSPFPVSYSLLRPDALLAEIARNYPIDQPERCLLWRSHANDLYRIETISETYFLKVYRTDRRTATDVAYEVDLLAYVATKGIQVATALRRHDGSLFGTLIAPEGVRPYVLFRQADGVKPKRPFTEQLYYRFGRATALLHDASADFVSLHHRAPLDLRHFLDRPLASLQPWLAARPDDWHYLVALADKVRRYITALAPSLDWGPCHGDLSLDNLHMRESGEIIFYDFDSGGPGWRASDPYGVYRYAREGNLPLWEPFLRGYREVRLFSEAELLAVPYFAAAYAIESLGNLAANWSVRHGRWILEDQDLDQHFAALRQWDTSELHE